MKCIADSIKGDLLLKFLWFGLLKGKNHRGNPDS